MNLPLSLWGVVFYIGKFCILNFGKNTFNIENFLIYGILINCVGAIFYMIKLLVMEDHYPR